MDILAVSVQQEQRLGLYATAVVNGQELSGILEIDAFFTALTSDGLYPLFTCNCGVFECGGRYVDVLCGAGAWVWRNRYAPSRIPRREHILEKLEFSFAWTDVYATAVGVLDNLRRAGEEHLYRSHATPLYGAALTDRLRYYQEQISVIPAVKSPLDAFHSKER